MTEIWQHGKYVRLSALKYCQYHTGHLLAFSKTVIKVLKQGVKFVQTYQVPTTIEFRLGSDFYKP